MGGRGSSFVERLPLPVFSGDPLKYPDFKSLFKELVASMKVNEAASLEYLRN